MIEYFVFFLIRKNTKFAFEFGQIIPGVFESIFMTARLLSYYNLVLESGVLYPYNQHDEIIVSTKSQTKKGSII